MSAPRVLILGGVDPCGGAGLDADREAAAEVGVQAVCVATAHTDQDDREVRAVGAVEPASWSAAARAVGEVHALKLGLLPGAEHVRAACELARGLGVVVVLDPLIASSSGYRFLDEGGLEALRAELLPVVTVVTPNLPEAAELAGQEIATPAQRVAAARRLRALGAGAVVLKGGHGGEDPVRDLVLGADGEPHWTEHPRAAGRLRGTGCRFATALAGWLARGRPLLEAAEGAGSYVARRIAEAGSLPSGACLRQGES